MVNTVQQEVLRALAVCLSACPSGRPSIRPSVCLSVHLSVCLFVYLFYPFLPAIKITLYFARKACLIPVDLMSSSRSSMHRTGHPNLSAKNILRHWCSYIVAMAIACSKYNAYLLAATATTQVRKIDRVCLPPNPPPTKCFTNFLHCNWNITKELRGAKGS